MPTVARPAGVARTGGWPVGRSVSRMLSAVEVERVDAGVEVGLELVDEHGALLEAGRREPQVDLRRGLRRR